MGYAMRLVECVPNFSDGRNEKVINAIRWVFAPFSSKIVRMGKSGSCHTARRLNSFLNAVSLAATAEVIVAGRKAGLRSRH